MPVGGDNIVVDPCAGWGGRLLGTLCILPHKGHVRYYGVDPNRHNQGAYNALLSRVRAYLKREIGAPRCGRVSVQPFEKWIHSKTAASLRGQVALVMTSPPYWSAEVYDTESKGQSANRYPDYPAWREHFLTPLIQGAYDLIFPGGVFCLNIADVTGATLERDTRRIAREVGFRSLEFFKLAMSRSVGTKGGKPRHAVQVDGVVWKHEPVFCLRNRPNPPRKRMDINKKPIPLTTIRGMRPRINTNPDYQRPAVWTTAQKQLLVDTVLRDYDVLSSTGESSERSPTV